MNNPNYQKTASFVESRFADLLLSDDFALSRLGFNREELRQSSTRALLDIEAKAQEKKQKRQETEQEFKVYVSEFFHETLFEYLEQRVADPDYIFTELLNFEPELPKLFDACAAKASGATQFEQIITTIPWLKSKFIETINNPPFRQAKSIKPKVQNLGLAIRYIGLDNTKLVVLSLAAQHWLPHSTEPYNTFKTRYWQYAIATANCSRQLAKYNGLNEVVAFFLGLFHAIGTSVALRLYLRAFDTVRIAQMKDSLKTGRRDIEKVLNSLESDPNFISEALSKFSNQISYKIFEKLGLKYAVVAPYAEEIKNKLTFSQASPMTQVLMQARTFAQYKILQKARLIELDEAKIFLTNYKINNTVIAELNQVNLTNIKYTK